MNILLLGLWPFGMIYTVILGLFLQLIGIRLESSALGLLWWGAILGWITNVSIVMCVGYFIGIRLCI